MVDSGNRRAQKPENEQPEPIFLKKASDIFILKGIIFSPSLDDRGVFKAVCTFCFVRAHNSHTVVGSNHPRNQESDAYEHEQSKSLQQHFCSSYVFRSDALLPIYN